MVPVSDQDMNTHLAEVSRVRNTAVIFWAIYIALPLKLQSLKISVLVTPVIAVVVASEALTLQQTVPEQLLCRKHIAKLTGVSVLQYSQTRMLF